MYLRGNTRSRKTRGKQKEINKETRRKQEGDHPIRDERFLNSLGVKIMATGTGGPDIITPSFNSAGVLAPFHSDLADTTSGGGGADFIDGGGATMFFPAMPLQTLC